MSRTTALPRPAPHAVALRDGVAALRRLPFLAEVAEEEVARLVAAARWRTLAPGETVLDVEDAGQDVYFVTEGQVRAVLRTATGHEIVLDDLGAGEFFGELAAIDGAARSASVTALVRARLCVVPGPVFMHLVLHAPPAGLRLLRLLASRLRTKDARVLEAVALPIRERVLSELLRLARARADGTCVVSPPPSQGVLAARLSLRRETVSREIAKLAREGVLGVGRGGLVLNGYAGIRARIDALMRQDG